MDHTPSVAVVGAGQAGATLAIALRQQGYSTPITLFGSEVHPPTERPSLSKELLSGAMQASQLQVQPAAQYEAMGIRLRMAAPVTQVQPDAHTLTCSDGSVHRWSRLVFATGGSPRVLPTLEPDGSAFWVYRTGRCTPSLRPCGAGPTLGRRRSRPDRRRTRLRPVRSSRPYHRRRPGDSTNGQRAGSRTKLESTRLAVCSRCGISLGRNGQARIRTGHAGSIAHFNQGSARGRYGGGVRGHAAAERRFSPSGRTAHPRRRPGRCERNDVPSGCLRHRRLCRVFPHASTRPATPRRWAASWCGGDYAYDSMPWAWNGDHRPSSGDAGTLLSRRSCGVSGRARRYRSGGGHRRTGKPRYRGARLRARAHGQPDSFRTQGRGRPWTKWRRFASPPRLPPDPTSTKEI